MTDGAARTSRPAVVGRRAGLLRDLLAGLSVALVLVPQAIAYAQLAGLPPSFGLRAAAAAPIAAAFFASSPYLQTGPTALTALLTFGALAALAEPFSAVFGALALLLAVLVGAIRLTIGLVRLGAVSYLMSEPVVQGFTLAAGLLIAASQLPAVLGVSTDARNPLVGAWQALSDPGAWHLGAIAVAIGTVMVLAVSDRLHPLVPGALLAAVGGIAVAEVFGYDAPLIGEVPSAMPSFGWDLPLGSLTDLLVPAVVIALVGFAETASIARRYATADRTKWKPDQEFVSQGTANLASGLFGGLPVGGSFSRSALNRAAGARTRWSGAVAGAAVLAFVPFAGVLASLPTAVLGAIVISAVSSLLNVRPLRRYWRHTRLQFGVAAATLAASLVLAPRVDLGVVLGVGLAVGAHLYREAQIHVPGWVDADVLHLRPHGVLYFGSAPSLEESMSSLLADHPEVEQLLIHVDGLGRVDVTGAMVLRTLIEEARESSIGVGLVDVPPQSIKVLDRILGDLLDIRSTLDVDAVDE